MKHLLSSMLGLLCAALPAAATQVGVYCTMAATGHETYLDGNICARMVLSGEGTALLEVENLTDRIIFIDRGRSFSWVNGHSCPLFTPQSTTESHTYGRGIIEDGGTPHNPTKWVTTEQHTQSHTVYDQRIQPIAPHGRGLVYAWEALPQLLRRDVIRTGNGGGWFRYNCRGKFCDTGQKFQQGDSRTYTAESTPLVIRADLEYSFDEAGREAHRAQLGSHVESIVIGDRKGIGKDGRLLHPEWLGGPGFAFRSGKPAEQIVGEWLAVAGLVTVFVAIGSADSMPDGWDMPGYPSF